MMTTQAQAVSNPTASNPIQMEHLDHVVLRVTDLERSIEWYQRVLGCTIYRKVDKAGLAQMRTGTSLIDLCAAAGPMGQERGGQPDQEVPNMHHLCIKITTFDEAALVAHFESHGVKPLHIGMLFGADGYGPCIYVADPDGNWLELKGPSETPPPGVV